jgi:hypothetical protein
VLASNSGRDNDYPEALCGIPQALQANVELISRLGPGHCFPGSFQFTYHPTLHIFDTEESSLNNPCKKRDLFVLSFGDQRSAPIQISRLDSAGSIYYPVLRSCESRNRPSGSIKGEEEVPFQNM